MNTSERAAELGHKNMVLHPFTVRKIAEGKALYEAMTKPKGAPGSITNRSIHRKPVWGQGYAFHGHK